MMSFFHKKDSSSKKNSTANTSTLEAAIGDTDSIMSSSSSSSQHQPQSSQQQQQQQQHHQVPYSSSSSIDSQNSHAYVLQQPSSVNKPPPPVITAAKPKKGILKTMSKFTMGGGHTSGSGSGSGGNGGSSHLPSMIMKPIETTSLPIQRQSQALYAQPSPNQTPVKPPLQTQPSSMIEHTSVKYRSVPLYLTTVAAAASTPPQSSSSSSLLDGTRTMASELLDAALLRWVEVTVEKLDLINLSTAVASSTEPTGGPIFIDAPLIDDFLPGDQLIAIEQFSMLGKSVDDVKSTVNRLVDDDQLQNRLSTVRFKVRTSLAVSELVVRNLAAVASPMSPTKSAASSSGGGGGLDKSASNTSISSSTSASSISMTPIDDSDSSSVWLVHPNGAYSAAKTFAKIVHKSLNDSPNIIKFKIRLENGQLIEVPEEHLEKANSSTAQCDLAPDLTHLRYLNETSLIHTLLTRFCSLQLIHTRLGTHSLVVLKPTQSMIDSAHFRASLYSDKVVNLVRRSSPGVAAAAAGAGAKPRSNAAAAALVAPPHVYSFVHAAYRRMLTDRQDQSIVAMGHTAAGKTTNIKFALNYLFKVAAPNSALFTEDKLNAMFCLLNAFGAIRTDRNRMGANRFLNLFLLEFNHAGQLTSLLLQLIQFDQTRLFFQPAQTSNYLIFYYLLNGANQSLKNELHLNGDLMSTSHLFNNSCTCLNNDDEDFASALALVVDSFRVLAFEQHEIKALFTILAALVHLGRAGAVPIQQQQPQQQQSQQPSTPQQQSASQQQRLGQFKYPNEAHIAASLLGVSFNQLNDFVFTLNNASMANGSSTRSKFPSAAAAAAVASSSRGSPAEWGQHGGWSSSSATSAAAAQLQPLDCLHGFCLGLYTECISLITNCLNRAFASVVAIQSSSSTTTPHHNHHHHHHQPVANCMLLLDPPGFQYQSTAASSASYSDLVCNYVAERLQLAFYQVNFITPIEKCAQEGLDVDTMCEHIPESPSSIVNWFDRPPPHGPNSGTPVGFNRTPTTANGYGGSSDASNCGLLWLLEDQMYSASSSSGELGTFLKRLTDSDPRHHFCTVTQSTSGQQQHQSFTVYHQFGQFAVDYSLAEWLVNYNKEYLTQRNALPLLQQSKRDYVSHAFISSAAMSNAAAMLSALSQNSSSNSGGTSEPAFASSGSGLKRQASVRRMLTMSKRKTFSMNLKLQIDSIFDSLRKTRPHFLFCLLPSLSATSSTPDVGLMRAQLKSYQLLAAARIYRQGYAEHMNYEEFERRFGMFLSTTSSTSTSSSSAAAAAAADSSLLRTSFTGTVGNDVHKQTCVNILKALELDASLWRLGSTQLFFKSGVLARLDELRDERLESLIVRLQALARRHLAQKSFDKKKIHQTAIRCLQKNIRIWFALKQWRWWRLYTHLKPIVNVQSHETMLKQLREELDDMRRKNDRLMNDKNELKMMNNQLEAKLMNLQTDYVEEHAANAGTLDLLEVETSERIRLERELNELRPLYNESQKKLEQLETEMLELRLYTTKQSIEQELARKDDDDDDDGKTSGGTSQQLTRSIKTTTTTLTATASAASSPLPPSNDNDNSLIERMRAELSESVGLERAAWETRMRDKDAELVELERQCSALKRKYQKVCEQVQDVERACDEYKVRNRDLERVQAKYDSDMAVLRAKWEDEREVREKCEREREQCKYELFAVKSDLETQKLETVYHQEKCERLEKDLKELESALASTTMNSSSIVGTGGSVVGGGSVTSPSSSMSSLNLDPTTVAAVAAATATASSNQHYYTSLVKSKSAMRDMEARLRDQEEELDEQALLIQQLEQAKLRLEMQLEKERQKWSRELAEKDAEMDDVRFHTQKKIKAVEAQLEEESEAVSVLQREKRDLERKLRDILANAPPGLVASAANANHIHTNGTMLSNEVKLKRQMLKYKQLALDAQTQLEKLRESIPKQSILKALKAQLEDSEITKANALKAKQLLQVEIDNLQQQLDESNSQRLSLEEQVMHLNREINNLKSELEEQERDADEVLKKYQNHVQNYTLDSHRFIDLNNQIDMLTIENRLLKEKIRELEEKCGYYETSYVDKTLLSKIEHKMRDLEGKLEFETTFKTRLQNQLERVKQQYENCSNEIDVVLAREKKCEEQLRKAQRNNKETLEEYGEIKKKLIDLEETKKRLEQQNEILERELETAKSELNVSAKRLEAFQNALNEMNDDEDDDEDNDVDDVDDDDDESTVSDEINGGVNNEENCHNDDVGEDRDRDRDRGDEDDDANVEIVEADPEIDPIEHTKKTTTTANIANTSTRPPGKLKPYLIFYTV